MDKGLTIKTLGDLTIQQDNEYITNFSARKAKALLTFLVVENESPHQREGLCVFLWPGMPEKSARHNLSQTLYALRQFFPEVPSKQTKVNVPLILSDRQTIQINPDVAIDTDVHQFDGLLEGTKKHKHQRLEDCPSCISALKKAASLYHGDFLSDFYLEDSNQFEEWAEAVREVYRRKLIETLAILADISIQKANYPQALTYIERQLVVDDLNERAYYQKIEVLAHTGQRVEAMRQYREFSQCLEEDLGTTPSKEITALYERIRSEDLAALRPQPDLSTSEPAAPRHNLVPQPTSFIGRQEELDQLDEMLNDPDIRLVTIVAPGGMGKTRLAIACAERQLAREGGFETHPYSDGVFFVPFAQVVEFDRIVSTIAESINIKLESEASVSQSPRAQLLRYLQDQQMLLIVDNFEHLIIHVDFLVEILQKAPGVELLVTSRERLNIRAEQVFSIGGLPIMDIEGSPEIIAKSPASQLLIHTAQRVQSDFQILDDDDQASLSLICQLVGGMPLALELAAGWVDLLSLAEIAAEIQRSLDFLESDLRDLPERHRSVQAVLDSTWERLDQNERDVFLRFSVLKGGCTREAAQTITGASLRTLTNLIKKSLIQYRSSDGRYLVHELLRQYAAEKLSQDPTTEKFVYDAHSAYFCAKLQRWETYLNSSRQSQTIAHFKADYQNIQAAWNWSVEKMDFPNMTSAVRGLAEYFAINYLSAEAESIFSRATQKIQDSYGLQPDFAEAAWLLAYLFPRQLFTSIPGIYIPENYVNEKMENVLLQSLLLLETPALAAMDTRQEQAFIEMQLGMVAGQEHRSKHLDLSAELYKELGDLDGITNLCYQGGVPNALDTAGELQKLLTKNLAQLRKFGDPERIVRTLIVLGQMAENEPERFQRFDEAYNEARLRGHLMGMANARRAVSHLYQRRGKFDHALRCVEEGLDLCLRTGNRYRSALFLVEIGLVEAYLGHFSRAITFLEEGISIYQSEALMNYKILAEAYLHVGQYENAAKVIKMEPSNLGWPWIPSSWLALKEKRYSDALADSQQRLLALNSIEWYAWVRVPFGFALHNLGRCDKAKIALFEALQTSLLYGYFLPLMHLMPVIPVVMADCGDQVLQERAVELYAMAKTLPFVANSKLFEDIAEKPLQEMTAHLPQEVILATQARGQALDWWETAAVLLDELQELGWSPVEA